MLAVLISGPATQDASAPPTAQVRDVSYCDLAKDPSAYDKTKVKITAFVTYGFEDFSLADPSCELPKGLVSFSVWVTFGGEQESGVIYCCPGEALKRGVSLVVDGVPVSLVTDQTLAGLRRILTKERSSVVRLTSIGTFFAGREETDERGSFWGGYGHLGGSSLFVIEKVESFEPHSRKDLDYAVDDGSRDIYVKCSDGETRGYLDRYIHRREDTLAVMREQAAADNGERAWALRDPERVARESLAAESVVVKGSPRTIASTGGRRLFEWRDGKTRTRVLVVRPYWLTFFARGSDIAWVVTGQLSTTCK